MLANGSLSSQQSGEGEIRKAIIEADLVDCIVSLPGQLFFTTQIPVSLWFLARDKSNGLVRDKRLRDRRRETLFIDARALGEMETRTLKVLTDADIAKVAGAYHAWRETRRRLRRRAGLLKGGDDGRDRGAGLRADAGALCRRRRRRKRTPSRSKRR